MKLTANLKLRFSIERRHVVVESSTFEKATFDQFLAVSIATHANERDGKSYIKDITGKGSLNEHLEKLVEEAREMDKEERERILSSSLYPTIHIDDSQYYIRFIPFGKTLMNGELFDGDLSEQLGVLKKAVMYTGELKKITIRDGAEKEITDNYRVILEDDGGEIEIAPKEWVKATPEQLEEMVVREYSVTEQIEKMAIKAIEGEGWNFLSASFLNGPMKDPRGFFAEEDGVSKYFLITNEGVKETVIGQAYGVYLYRETIRSFDPSNASLCDQAAMHLMKSRELENYKTKSLVVLLSSCTGPVAQKIINYELSVKSSSELARLGLTFLERGLNSGWEVSALSRMKNIASPKQKELIYKMDSSSFDLNDLIGMDRSILKPEDFQKVVDHEKERTTKLDYIKDVIGKVMMSGLRERSKKTKSDAETKDFHKFINTLIAHNKNDMSGLSDDQLNSVYRLAKRLESMLPSIEAKCRSAEEEDK